MKKTTKQMLFTMPAVIFIAGTILVGAFIAVVQSFGYFPEIGLTTWTIDYYRSVFNQPLLLHSFMYSFKTAFLSSVVGVGFGVVAGYLLVTYKKELNLYRRFLGLPVAVPHIIVVVIVFNLFIRTGFVSRLLVGSGLLESFEQFPSLLFTDSGFGVMAVYFWKAFPYTIMVLYSVLRSIHHQYRPVSMNLGARNYQYFFHVVLPMAKPMILTTTIILFAFSFSSYEVPFLLGATVPKALPVQAYIDYTSPILENRPYAMAINVLMMVLAFVLIAVYDLVSSSVERRRNDA